MIEWAKEHPILASLSGLAIIILLYVLLHRGGGSSAQTISANPGGVSDAAYTAQLAAGAQSQQIAAAVQISQGQTAAELAASLAKAQNVTDQTAAARDVALQQTLSGAQVAEYSAATQLQGAQAKYGADIIEMTNTNDTAVKLAGIQSDVSKATIAAQLQLGLDTNKTAADIANTQGAYAYQTELVKDQAAGAIIANNNATAAEINAQNEATKQLAVTTQGQVENATISSQSQAITDQFMLQQQQINNQLTEFTGVNRYGGNLQSNQATVETAILNQPSVGVAIQQSSASQAQSSASLWSSIANGIIGGATKVATTAGL